MFSQFMLWLKTFVVIDERGQGIIEYALLAALISIVAIAILLLMSTQINLIYQAVLDAVTDAAP